MVHFIIIFDHVDRSYTPGETINLEIYVQVHSKTSFRSIYARIRGFAHCGWQDSVQVHRDGKMNTEYKYHYADETFFKHYQTLAGGPNMQLSAGSHVFHASFQLPLNLPENHEVAIGHIRYEAKVHMDVQWGFAKKERALFYVNPQVDLNEYQNLCKPVRDSSYKTFGFCCWQSAPLEMLNVLPRSGFVPGDRMRIFLELRNESNVSIYRAFVELVEKTVYHTYTPQSRTHKTKRVLWYHEFNDPTNKLVGAMQNRIFSADLYFDPAWNFRFFKGCGIINVGYYLKSEACTSGLHGNLTDYTWIAMGTIPFTNSGA